MSIYKTKMLLRPSDNFSQVNRMQMSNGIQMNNRLRSAVLIIGCLTLFLSSLGCGRRIHSAGEIGPIHGVVENGDGSTLSNVLLVLQPLENGYVTELEVGPKGEFSGEAIAGKYAFYFAPSKVAKRKELPKSIPTEYRDAKIDHSITISPGETIVCKIR